MKVSAKTEYACIAMLELARSYGTGEPVRIRTIAEQHNIPSRFLVQILLQLKGAGLVSSVRGAAGGYQLSKSPEDISLGDVMSVIEGPEQMTPACPTQSATANVLRRCWLKIEAARQEILTGTTLADLVEQAKADLEEMYYI